MVAMMRERRYSSTPSTVLFSSCSRARLSSTVAVILSALMLGGCHVSIKATRLNLDADHHAKTELSKPGFYYFLPKTQLHPEVTVRFRERGIPRCVFLSLTESAPTNPSGADSKSPRSRSNLKTDDDRKKNDNPPSLDECASITPSLQRAGYCRVNPTAQDLGYCDETDKTTSIVSAAVEARPVRDPAHLYRMDSASAFYVKASYGFSLSSDGVLVSSAAGVSNEAPRKAIAVLSNVIGLPGIGQFANDLVGYSASTTTSNVKATGSRASRTAPQRCSCAWLNHLRDRLNPELRELDTEIQRLKSLLEETLNDSTSRQTRSKESLEFLDRRLVEQRDQAREKRTRLLAKFGIGDVLEEFDYVIRLAPYTPAAGATFESRNSPRYSWFLDTPGAWTSEVQHAGLDAHAQRTKVMHALKGYRFIMRVPVDDDGLPLAPKKLIDAASAGNATPATPGPVAERNILDDQPGGAGLRYRLARRSRVSLCVVPPPQARPPEFEQLSGDESLDDFCGQWGRRFTVFDQPIPIAQYGRLMSLPQTYAGLEANIQLELDPATGAARGMKSDSAPFDDSAVLQFAPGAISPGSRPIPGWRPRPYRR